MDVDPMEAVENNNEDQPTTTEDKKRARLNSLVAVTVAILATFMGICKVKDDNIVQQMQLDQAEKIDHWGYYQARNIREEIAKSTASQLELQAATAPSSARAAYQTKIAEYRKLEADQHEKKAEEMEKAKAAEKDYDAWNIHDDQFDLSDALLAISISLLALTALTHNWKLFWFSMIPTFFGVLMGVAGLFKWPLHPDFLTKLLGT